MKRIILFLAVAVLLVGCFKKVAYKTDYILKPLVQQDNSSEPTLPLPGVKLYAYDADTTLWTVASYDDAVAAVISQRDNRNEKQTTPLVVAEPYEQEGTEGWLRMQLNKPLVMIVAVDTQHRLYAYTQQQIPENFPNLYVSLVFKTWKEGTSYRDGKWVFFNDFYLPPTLLECTLNPQLQEVEDAEPVAFAGLKMYAFAVDTTAWKIASYDDAVAQKITSKTDPTRTRTTADFKGYEDKTTGAYEIIVSKPTLMVVVVDAVNKIYAYSKQTVDLEGAPVTFPTVIFSPWKQEYIYVEEGGWRLVNEKYIPKVPETASNRAR